MIRPLERPDLPAVVEVHRQVMRPGVPHGQEGRAEDFGALFLDSPSTDPEIPSLVYEADDGSITGFIGVSVRRALYRGRSIRIVCGSGLVAHPRVRARGAGAFLLKKVLDGPQELTIADSASNDGERVLRRLGAHVAHLQGFVWRKVLRPAVYALDRYVLRSRLRKYSALTVPTKILLDAKSRRGPVGRDGAAFGRELTPDAMAQHADRVFRGYELHPEYSKAFATWLLSHLGSLKKYGWLEAVVVRDAADEVIGWYLYYANRGGVSRVIQVAAPREHVGAVLDDLFAHAMSQGSAAIEGRLEPHLVDPIHERRCAVQHGSKPLIVHSRDPEVFGLVASERAIVSRVEGEEWVRTLSEDFSDPPNRR